MRNLYNLTALILLSILTFTAPAQAQRYISVSGAFSLYCVVLPDGTTRLGQYNKGTKNIELIDADAQIKSLSKNMSGLRQRVQALSAIIRDNGKPTKVSLSNWNKVLKLIATAKSREARRAKASNLRKNFNEKIAELREAIDNIESCIDRDEDFIFDSPEVSGADIDIVTVPLANRFNESYHIYGALLRGMVSKASVSQGSVCVSRSGGNSDFGRTLPFEKHHFLYKNPCLGISGSGFNFIDCSKWFSQAYGKRARGRFVVWFLASGANPSSTEARLLNQEYKPLTPIYVASRKKCNEP